MTRFEDGPAAGQCLYLRRSPALLRVVRDEKCAWDALDAPADMPKIGEAVFVYRLVRVDGHCHIRGQKVSGFFPLATYRLCEVQPDDDTVRGIKAWAVWRQQHEGKVP
jgi:hypothetical protein